MYVYVFLLYSSFGTGVIKYLVIKWHGAGPTAAAAVLTVQGTG